MKIRNKGFVAAMEDDEVVDPTVIDPNAVVEVPDEVPAEVEQESAEVTDEADTIVDDVEAMEDAVEDAETLDEIADVAETSAEEGEGLDPVAAEITEVAIERIYDRLGVRRKATPSLEAFGSAGSRKSATRIAVEETREVVKKVWDNIVKFFTNLWERLKSFMASLMDHNVRLGKAAEAMAKSVKDLAADAKAEGEITSGSVTKALSVNGKADAESTHQILSNHIGFTESMAKLYESMTGAIKGMDTVIAAGGAGAAEQGEKQASALMSGFAAAAGHTSGHAASDREVKAGPFVGGKMLSVSRGEGGDGIKLGFTDGAAAAEKAAVLSREEMARTVSAVQEVVKANVAYKTDLARVDGIVKAVQKAASDAFAAAGKVAAAKGGEGETDLRKGIGDARKLVSSIGSSVGKLASGMPSMNVSAAKSALNYVAASLKAHKAPKAEPAPKAE